ncbi:acyl carrier protein [Streptomyces parvus]|uniref:acyl carrier protein n=1 Tax=Streptomyces parvus TaxID=66428 RepID=UPI003719D95E
MNPHMKDPSTHRPRVDIVSVVSEVWCEVLALPDMSPTDNFFDLGGHSILLHAVREGLGRRLGRDVPLVELFRYPTVRAMAAYLDGGSPHKEEDQEW